MNTQADHDIQAFKDAAEHTVKSMCEGFCDDLPMRTTYTESMDFDCSVCRLRAALAKVTQP